MNIFLFFLVFFKFLALTNATVEFMIKLPKPIWGVTMKPGDRYDISIPFKGPPERLTYQSVKFENNDKTKTFCVTTEGSSKEWITSVHFEDIEIKTCEDGLLCATLSWEYGNEVDLTERFDGEFVVKNKSYSFRFDGKTYYEEKITITSSNERKVSRVLTLSQL